MTEAVARSDASAGNPPREPTQLATAKPKACPPPLPPAARPSRVTPPPLPAAVHVATELAPAVAIERAPAVAIERTPAVAIERARPVAIERAPAVAIERARPVAIGLAPPVATELAPPVFRSTREAEIPDFLDGAARRRRVLWTVLALAGLVLVAAVIATIASHYRPM